MEELFQPSHELIHNLLEVIKAYPELPVIQLPAPNRSMKAEKSKPKAKPQQVTRVEFIELERNLASLGFFSASSKRIKNKKGKTLTLTKTINGHKVKVSAEIIPGSRFGLPGAQTKKNGLPSATFSQNAAGRTANLPTQSGSALARSSRYSTTSTAAETTRSSMSG